MIDTPHITRSNAQLTAVVRLKIPRKEIRHVMGPAIAELMATLSAQGITPAGMVFSHHLRMDPEVFDFEVGVPVTEPISPTGRVIQGQLPARAIAQTVYHGAYEGLGAAWGEFNGWISAHGHTPDKELWECYVAGPETSAEASTWCTELNRPLVNEVPPPFPVLEMGGFRSGFTPVD